MRALNQDNLPSQFRSGVCPMLNLTGVMNPVGTPPPKPNPDGAVIAKPLSILIGMFVVVVPLTLSIVF